MFFIFINTILIVIIGYLPLVALLITFFVFLAKMIVAKRHEVCFGNVYNALI